METVVWKNNGKFLKSQRDAKKVLGLFFKIGSPGIFYKNIFLNSLTLII